MQAKIRNAARLSAVQTDEALQGRGSSSRGRGRSRNRGRGRGRGSGRGSKEAGDEDLDQEDEQATNEALLEDNEADKPKKQAKPMQAKTTEEDKPKNQAKAGAKTQAKTTEDDKPKKQAKAKGGAKTQAKTTEDDKPKEQAKAKAQALLVSKQKAKPPAEKSMPSTVEEDCPSQKISSFYKFDGTEAIISAPVQECDKVKVMSDYQKDQD